MKKKYIYTLNSKSLETAVGTYIDYITNPRHEYRQKIGINMMGGEIIYNGGKGIMPLPLSTETNIIGETVKEVITLPKPKPKTALRDICIFVDAIYRKWRRQKTDAPFTYSSAKFREMGVRNYNYIARVLRELGYIYYAHGMKDGDKFISLYNIEKPEAFHLRLLDKVKDKEIITIKKEQETKKTREHKLKLKEIIKRTSKEFVEKYNENLSLLTIDKDRATQIIATLPTQSQKYYEWFVDRLLSDESVSKELNTIDDNGRIYHIGSEMPNKLKGCTNIKYIYDAANSHVVLFAVILLRYIIEGRVSVDENVQDEVLTATTRTIIDKIKRTENFHIFGNSDCNLLNECGIDDVVIGKLKDVHEDIFRFIADAMNGRVWDKFCDKHPDSLRSEVKQSLFCDVFYSYSEKGSQWVQEFKTEYPHVAQMITQIKKDIHRYCKENKLVEKTDKTIVLKNGYKLKVNTKDSIMLPHLMMRLESKIFTHALMRLFDKNVKCFGVHDAIYVLKDDTSGVDVKQTLLDVYYEYGILPTLHCEAY